MTTRKIDRRTERTRAALMSAFVELLLSEGYESVAMGDIARRANVGRSTLYSHYTSKEALLAEGLQRQCAGLAACTHADATSQMLIPLLDHFREQHHINRVFFENPIRRLWVRQLAVSIERGVAPHRRTIRKHRGLPRFLLASVIAEMQIALIVHWLSDATFVKSEIIAEALVFNTHAMLERPPQESRRH
jgi:AcrR family transcriptional regulator